MDATRTAIRSILNEAQVEEPYPLAGAEVSGLRVGDEVPNTDSISASLTDYKVLRGIREVPLSDFDDPGRPYSVDERLRIENLTREIQANGWIAPLIVVLDSEPGPYILEGGHRFSALHVLGVESLPALVVMDTGEVSESLTEEHWTDYGHGPTGVAWALIDGQIMTQDDEEYIAAKWTGSYADDVVNFHMWATSEMRANFHGRYDPEQKVITLGSARQFYSDRSEREFKLDRISAMLKAKWPGNIVLYFAGGGPGKIVASCRQIMRGILLTESPVTRHAIGDDDTAEFYFGIGHGDADYMSKPNVSGYDDKDQYTDPMTHEIWLLVHGGVERHQQVKADELDFDPSDSEALHDYLDSEELPTWSHNAVWNYLKPDDHWKGHYEGDTGRLSVINPGRYKWTGKLQGVLEAEFNPKEIHLFE